MPSHTFDKKNLDEFMALFALKRAITSPKIVHIKIRSHKNVWFNFMSCVEIKFLKKKNIADISSELNNNILG